MLRNYRYDALENIKKFVNPEDGLYIYFRQQCMEMQARFTEIFSPHETPLVFLHGNPHLDNYARTSTGCGMIDFDRSRIGPYAWDIVRFMGSLALRQKKESLKLPKETLEAIKDAYLTRVMNPDLGYAPYSGLMEKKPKDWQKSTRNYIKAEKKWAEKLKESPGSKKDPRVQTLYEQYARSRNKLHHLKEFEVKKVGLSVGSLGKPRFLVLLSPHDSSKDEILLDIKEVYNDPDTRYFYNPYVRQGHRMVEASQLYCPGVEQRVGYANLDGKEYWVRQIPPFQVKVKGNLDAGELEEFAHCVTAQLAMGHSRSLMFTRRDKLASHFKAHFNEYSKLSEILLRELIASHQEYKKQVKREMASLSEQAFA